MNAIHTHMAQAGFVRSSQNRVFGGVCAGLARRFGTDPWAIRLLLILVLMVLPGSQLIVYPLAWVLMPDDTFVPAPTMPGAPTATTPNPTTPNPTPQDVVG